MFYRNRYTLLSLILLCGMYMIYSLYYSPESSVRKGVAMVEGNGAPQIGGDFELLNTKTNQMITQEILQNRFSLIFFGFSNCPDVCPTGLSLMSSAYERLPQRQQEKLNMFWVSLDPERDTPEVMQDYAAAFHDDLTALYGTEEQMAAMASKYLVYHVKMPADEDGNYMINHSGYIYLMGPDGKYIKHFSHKSTEEEILSSLTAFLSE